MTGDEASIQRIANWRFRGLGTRLLQGALVAVLAYIATQSILIPIWFGLSVLSNLIDAWAFAWVLARPNSAFRVRLGWVTMTVSSTLFAAIGPVILVRHGLLTEAGAALLLCAISLNNAVMCRSSRQATRIVVIGCGLMMMVGMPMAAAIFGHMMTWVDTAVLAAAFALYLIFIGITVSTLRREGDELKAAHARWRLLFEHSPLPQLCVDASALHEWMLAEGLMESNLSNGAREKSITLGDINRRVVMTESNKALLQMVGIDALPQGPGERHVGADFVEGLLRSLQSGETTGEFEPFDCQMVHASGDLIDVRVHIHTVADIGKPWSVMILNFVDVSDARRAAAAQQQALLAAQSASRAKSDFLATMSHEIRTPLNGVLGMVQALEHGDASEDQRRKLEVIGRSGETLLAILNDILDLSKIEAGKLELGCVSIDVQQMLRDLKGVFDPAATAKGISLILTTEGIADRRFMGDAIRLRQILNNLVANAIKFTAEGSVQVDAVWRDDWMEIAVTDTGRGIAPDRVGHLFEKFTQEDSTTTREFGGTGLGLSICRELCSLLGGTISVVSELGEGSRFMVRLPLPLDGAIAGATEGGPHDAATAGALRVLAAEDNLMNQTVLKTLLAVFDITPVIVENGQQAVDAWEASHWDVILMDVQMPVMDGPAATRHIRRREAETGRATTPIIAVTANAMANQVADYLACGMNDIVAKPIQVSELMTAIAAIVPKAAVTSAVA